MATQLDMRQLPEDVQMLYQALAPACQREWTRYVLGAVKPTTQEKRLNEMIQALRQGKSHQKR